jgi:hypothetical protein
MTPVLPAMNTIWFWFRPEADRRRFHGTPEDVMRKFQAFHACGHLEQGLEIFIIPSRLKASTGFCSWFYKGFSQLPYRTVHIAEGEEDFLVESETAFDDLQRLARELKRLEVDTIILHAHHLRKERHKSGKLLQEVLSGITICVENNGFDNPWGACPESLLEIFHDLPEFKLCLDICHVKDYPERSLSDFTDNEELASRLTEIHFSYSTRQIGYDPYVPRGYSGYGPYHALFSVLGKCPSKKTKEFISNYPVVLEGIVPREDKEMEFLRLETECIHTTDTGSRE